MSNLLEPSVATRLLSSWGQDDLRGIVACAAGRHHVADFTPEFIRTIGGCAGYACPKVPVTFRWRDGEETGSVDVLMKATPWGQSEGAAYRYLEPLGAPIPRCYGALCVLDAALPEGWRPGTEVIFLEYLDHIGFDPACLADRLAFARAYAALHALPPHLPGAPAWQTMSYGAGVAAWHTRLCESVAAGITALPDTLVTDACTELRALLPHAADWLVAVTTQADTFPVALIHKDAAPQNTGWRGARTEPLIFDLQPMCVGGTMGDMLVLFPDIAFEHDDRQVAAAYCDALREHGGPSLTPDDIERGTRYAGMLRRISMLQWQLARASDGQVDWTDDTEEGRRIYQGWLLESLHGITADLRAFSAGREVCNVY